MVGDVRLCAVQGILRVSGFAGKAAIKAFVASMVLALPVCDVGLIQNGILALAVELVRDVLLKCQFRCFFPFGHGQSFIAPSRARANRTASCSFCSSSCRGSTFVQ